MAHKVFVGLSGGVDSAVSAALLQEQGFDVTGVFIKIWQPEFIECTWEADRLDALRVAAALGVPFREIDFSHEYKKHVVDSMVADYARGITPNPDVLCNRHIKFGAFAAWARAEGAEGIATGHYAQKKQDGGHLELLRAKDIAKDQSYFLYRLRQADLSRTVFPVGALLKAEVRTHAVRFGLPVAQKPDSQGLCFVGDVSMRDFLARFIDITPGPVVDREGKTIGEHEGAALYTLGQRHGFSVEGESATGPHYVVGIDVASNTVRVSTRREDAAAASVFLDDVHWIYREPHLPLVVSAQARYHGESLPVSISRRRDRLVATFAEPRIASLGQSLVFYDGEVCLGGAIIA